MIRFKEYNNIKTAQILIHKNRNIGEADQVK